MRALIGTKIGMTSIIKDDGAAIAVTLIKAGPVTVTQVRNEEVDGYSAVQVGYGDDKKAAKSQVGHAKKSKVQPKIYKEFKTKEELSVGDKFDVSIFEIGQKVKVTGKSKGKGFAGTIKRHNFSRGPKSHGSRSYRRPGSIGSMYPQKIFKGKKMAGRMGNVKHSIRNISVCYIDKEEHLIGLQGSVPGPRKGTVSIEAI